MMLNIIFSVVSIHEVDNMEWVDKTNITKTMHIIVSCIELAMNTMNMYIVSLETTRSHMH